MSLSHLTIGKPTVVVRKENRNKQPKPEERLLTQIEEEIGKWVDEPFISSHELASLGYMIKNYLKAHQSLSPNGTRRIATVLQTENPPHETGLNEIVTVVSNLIKEKFQEAIESKNLSLDGKSLEKMIQYQAIRIIVLALIFDFLYSSRRQNTSPIWEYDISKTKSFLENFRNPRPGTLGKDINGLVTPLDEIDRTNALLAEILFIFALSDAGIFKNKPIKVTTPLGDIKQYCDFMVGGKRVDVQVFTSKEPTRWTQTKRIKGETGPETLKIHVIKIPTPDTFSSNIYRGLLEIIQTIWH